MLSDYGLFSGNPALQKPAAGVFPYELNTALFTDYASKFRFIRVPDGTQVEFRESDVFEFPVGTVIAKTFGYPEDRRVADSPVRLLETRIETRLDSGWVGYTYIWNEAQTDAELALGGSEVEVAWIHDDGVKRSKQLPDSKCEPMSQLSRAT